jgi:hypothetical protein
VQNCEVCGRPFDPLGFQVVVPELARGFDRIECAGSARALGGAGAAPVPPLVAVVDPIGARPPLAVGVPLRALAAAPLAAIGLFAAGTAAAAYLWVGVLGADPTRFVASHAPIAKAFGHESVQAQFQPARPGPAKRPTAEAAVANLAAAGQGTAPAGAPSGATATAPSGATATAPPSPPGSARRIPASVARTSAPAKQTVKGPAGHGKDHLKHGKGHLMHGEIGGVHVPGHGQSHGHAHSQTHRHGPKTHH